MKLSTIFMLLYAVVFFVAVAMLLLQELKVFYLGWGSFELFYAVMLATFVGMIVAMHYRRGQEVQDIQEQRDAR